MPHKAPVENLPLTAAHWGVYRAEVNEGKLRALHPFERDPNPSLIANGYIGVLDDELRIDAPMVRKSWLENGPGSATDKRGVDPFVQVTWDEAETLVANELSRVKASFGNEAIYGGSYGWSGAGRFHHAQSQLHRFLNCIGGYTRSVNTYSLAAGEVILSHILGDPASFIHNPPSWQSVVENGELLVAFGGMPLRNSQISSGGTGAHRARSALSDAKKKGMSFVNISPMRSDVAADLNADWIAARPGSDVALMLAIAHEFLSNNWHDRSFLDRYTTGFETFARYVIGQVDGIVKSAAWAADIANVPAQTIKDLASRMATSRTLISVSWSLTRQEHGEQPFWMATTLAAMLGQIGLPGAGIAFGYCAANSIGMERQPIKFASFQQGKNPVTTFIPVARISDMLLNPGSTFRFNGQTLTYPDIKLVYWAGGNPFHHHQDLTKLERAWQKPDTIIAHEWCWNALAKRSDIVLPCTTQLERRDLMMTPRDPYIVSMEEVVPPHAEARDDYEIFTGISRKLGVDTSFTEGRSSDDWLRWLYEESRQKADSCGVILPDYATFTEKGWHYIDPGTPSSGALEAFRKDPRVARLETQSGRIEICCAQIADSRQDNILPHPAWYAPEEWLGNATGKHRLHLISGQPADKLHSQLDHGPESQVKKVNGRAVAGLNPVDAETMGVCDGVLLRVYNERGACLVSARLDPSLMQGCIAISTGAWLDAARQEDGTLICQNGNPNTLTRDQGTSDLAQGPAAHSCLVSIEKLTVSFGQSKAYLPPVIQRT
ncbi:molybdopterin-dependent oxidoreductase [Phaeobacter piscinae]|uniref:molybdopterin-dependent oxidoreductase n=1 Tax=Phaeobacter piscinae TaxID=1580596 RepID=UPI00058BBCA0|nr:molybdopterin-dependent oxidoreductase [Phaeobacter piscinae]UTS81157.1 Dimethyl sulfoxide/trimethylamine N-oxide reductase [Phaeobacter piscinae]